VLNKGKLAIGGSQATRLELVLCPAIASGWNTPPSLVILFLPANALVFAGLATTITWKNIAQKL
jgi:hypothetical protein